MKLRKVGQLYLFLPRFVSNQSSFCCLAYAAGGGNERTKIVSQIFSESNIKQVKIIFEHHLEDRCKQQSDVEGDRSARCA